MSDTNAIIITYFKLRVNQNLDIPLPVFAKL